jgi:S1-C subfamily serine protease
MFTTVLKVSLLLMMTCSAFAQPPWAWEPFWKGENPRGSQLGIHVDELSFGRLDSMQLPYGVVVTHVIAGSPAQAGGLRNGDILLEINGQPVFSVSRLRWLIDKPAADARLELKYYRDGETLTTDIALMRPPRRPSQPPRSQTQWDWASPAYLGMNLQPLTEGLREAFAVPDGIGVLITEVYADSAAKHGGLNAGDVIVKMDRRTIRNIDDVRHALGYFDPEDKLVLEIIRDKKREQVEVTLDKGKGPYAYGREWEWWQPYDEPHFPGPPFFVNPDWWREMQKFLDQWKHYWEYDLRQAPHQAM